MVSAREPKRARLWLHDGSCIRLRLEYPGHVWAYDLVEGRTHDGRKSRILTIIDEASRQCLAGLERTLRPLPPQLVLAAAGSSLCPPKPRKYSSTLGLVLRRVMGGQFSKPLLFACNAPRARIVRLAFGAGAKAVHLAAGLPANMVCLTG